jgi:preprotein translocase subunit SecA
MTPTQITILLTLFGILISILITLIGWIGGGMVDQLKKIAGSVNKIEKDLSVLSNDHLNLKTDFKELKDRVHALEDK